MQPRSLGQCVHGFGAGFEKTSDSLNPISMVSLCGTVVDRLGLTSITILMTRYVHLTPYP